VPALLYTKAAAGRKTTKHDEPFELTEQIFDSHLKKEQTPQTQFIPISQPNF